MSDYSSFTITVPVHIPVTKEVFEAWENLDNYQEYLMEDFDIFIYDAFSKIIKREQMNNYIKIACKHAQDSLDEVDNVG
jgi:predicted kinase